MGEEEKEPDGYKENRRSSHREDEVSPQQLSATTQTHLAWIRTRMAMENTLSAWVRTATSLIGFGFAMVQFFAQFARPANLHLVRYVGLLLMGMGTVTTVLAIWAYRRAVKYLQGDAFGGIAGIPSMRRFPDPALGVAMLVCLIGLFAFFAILAGFGSGRP